MADTSVSMKRAARVIRELERQGGGTVTPEAVVEAARSPTSPIHDLFEWDDQVAAHQHRLDQARRLIRSIKIKVEVEEVVISTVGYVHDPDLPQGEQGYIGTVSLMTERERSERVLTEECVRIRGLVARVRALAKSLDLEEEAELKLRAALND